MARTLNEQLMHEAGLAEPEPQKPGIVQRVLRLIFLARLGVLLLALAVAITFMVLPWPGDLRTVFYDLAAAAGLGLLARQWVRYRRQRQTDSQHKSDTPRS